VLGALWNGKDKPPRSNSAVIGRDGKVNQQVIRSRSGHEIILDDSSGSEKITIVDKTGNNKITIDSASNTLTFNGQANVKIESDGKISIKGSQVSIEADATVDVKGQVINLN
jgi:uncharacterized protein involved in type VI secretion and phage assembly